MPLNKMGQKTGWTLGYVSDTCVDYAWSLKANGKILCQDAVDQMYWEGTDSGSPVFYNHTTPAGDVELVGIFWGGFEDQEKAVFSRRSNIREDLGDFEVADPPISVSISGPGLIEQTGVYNWDANVSEQEGSVSYQWSIQWDGSSSWSNLGTSSSQSVSVNNDTDFTLRVEVTDASDSDTALRSVTVNLGGCSPTDPCS